MAAAQWFLGLLVIFKNDAHILDEFIQHYTAQGVEHFWLVDNNSSDCSLAVLKRTQASYTLLSMPLEGKIQSSAYKMAHQLIGNGTEWLLVVDTDEFVYAPDGSIASTLTRRHRQIKNAQQICMPWKVYGVKADERQPTCVVQSLVQRLQLFHEWYPKYWQCKRKTLNAAPRGARTVVTPESCNLGTYSHRNLYMGKCLLHTGLTTTAPPYIKAHMHVGRGTILCQDLKTVATSVGFPGGVPLKNKSMAMAKLFMRCIRLVPFYRRKVLLELNHYKFQSLDYMQNVKAKRGRISGATHFKVLGEMAFLEPVLRRGVRDDALQRLNTTTCLNTQPVFISERFDSACQPRV